VEDGGAIYRLNFAENQSNFLSTTQKTDKSPIAFTIEGKSTEENMEQLIANRSADNLALNQQRAIYDLSILGLSGS